tara:strand:- start:567 stop:728 length:162 start_codon:yes stop_codon:yes gene_type:complete
MNVNNAEVSPVPHTSEFAHPETLQVIHQQRPKKPLLSWSLDAHEESMHVVDEV